MTHDQQTRLLTLAHDCAMLTIELQNDRQHAEPGPDKARLRAVANYLDAANAAFAKATERMKG